MEGLPLGRIAALVPELAVKDLPLGRTLMFMMMNFKNCARKSCSSLSFSHLTGNNFWTHIVHLIFDLHQLNLVDIDIILFNDGHVLHLSWETVAARRRMNIVLDDYDGQMILGDECDLHLLTFVLQLRKNSGKISTRKMTRSGTEPGPAAWKATTLLLDHSGGHEIRYFGSSIRVDPIPNPKYYATHWLVSKWKRKILSWIGIWTRALSFPC